MPNVIKYSLSAQTEALKKGNFWIGTGDVGKGPTSSSDYWQGITPPTGGYTIYLNKASQGPSIYAPTNDASLITLTNMIGSQSFTSVTQCFNWYNTQSDKMVFNRDYPEIITSGLVLNLDAGFIPSYSTSGVTWYDISSGGNNGTLTNGPTFNSANGGSIVFDGSNGYVSCPKLNSLVSVSQLTTSAWMKRSTASSIVIISQTSSGTNDVAFELWNDGFAYFEVGNGSEAYGYVSNNSTSWQYLTMVFDGSQTGNSNRLKGYINGASQSLLFEGTIPATSGTVNNNFDVGRYLEDIPSNGNIATVQVYNRALSAAEVTQNYNATKSRFGL
jgi:hypothetical protein